MNYRVAVGAKQIALVEFLLYQLKTLGDPTIDAEILFAWIAMMEL